MKNLQVGFIALNKQGAHDGYSVYNGFNYALHTKTQNQLINAKFDRK